MICVDSEPNESYQALTSLGKRSNMLVSIVIGYKASQFLDGVLWVATQLREEAMVGGC